MFFTLKADKTSFYLHTFSRICYETLGVHFLGHPVVTVED